MKRSKEKVIDKRVEVLLEVGSEEIPAGMLPKAEEDLRANLEKLLAAENLSDGVTVETFSAPRRLVAHVRGLREKQADVESEVTGPPKSVAYDAVGEPTRAAHQLRGEAGAFAEGPLYREDSQGRVPCRQAGEARTHRRADTERNPSSSDS